MTTITGIFLFKEKLPHKIKSMENKAELIPPSGWKVYIEPGSQTGEDEYHSQYVDPDGKYGAAKSDAPNVSSYGG